MTGVVSTVLNYYGIVHLLYYGGQQFLSKAESVSPTWGSKESKAQVAAEKGSTESDLAKSDELEESEMANPELYLWLSKWVIFMTYMYLEPFILAMLDIVPGISILSVVFKLKILSTNNTWHQVVYDRTFGHLKDFDIFEIIWRFSSSRVIDTVSRLLKLTSYLFPKLTVEQLDQLGADLDSIKADLESQKKLLNHRATVRASRFLHKSQIGIGNHDLNTTPRKNYNTSEPKEEEAVDRKVGKVDNKEVKAKITDVTSKKDIQTSLSSDTITFLVESQSSAGSQNVSNLNLGFCSKPSQPIEDVPAGELRDLEQPIIHTSLINNSAVRTTAWRTFLL